MGVSFVAPAPFLVCFAVVSCWRSANLAVSSLLVVCFSRLFHDLPRYYGTKEFHDVFNLFTRLSQC